MSFDSRYLEVNIRDAQRNDLISLMTFLFEKKILQILIGTKALLGEGWDASVINTLMLASFVGSFVTSNRMRAAYTTGSFGENREYLASGLYQSDAPGGQDLRKLARRFGAFTGVAIDSDPQIINGVGRLQVFSPPLNQKSSDRENKRMCKAVSESGAGATESSPFIFRRALVILWLLWGLQSLIICNLRRSCVYCEG